MKTFYGLTANPFALPPDPQFFYWSATHRTTLQHLVRSHQSHKNIVVVTGARGMGKTILLQAFANAHEPRTRHVWLPQPAASIQELCVQLAQQLGLGGAALPGSDALGTLNAALLTRVQQRKKIVLLLDNAHEWSERLLAEIGIFAHLGPPTHKLFHIILAGPLSLPDTLTAPALASLTARVEVLAPLAPFDPCDTQAYIHRRLTLAGWPEETTLFAQDAVAAICGYADGVPRTINRLCSHALLAGFAARVARIDGEIIRQVATHLGLQAPAAAGIGLAAPVAGPRAEPRQREPAAPTTPPSEPRWPTPTGPVRTQGVRRRMARVALVLLPILVAAGTVVSGGWMQAPGLAWRAVVPPRPGAPQSTGSQPHSTATKTAADAVPPAPTVATARDSITQDESPVHVPTPPPPTSRVTRVGPPRLRAPLLVPATAPGAGRARPHRPSQPYGSMRLPTTPLQTRAAPPARGGLAAPVAHDTPDAQPPGATPPVDGATASGDGATAAIPAAPQPRVPRWPPPEEPGTPAALPPARELPTHEARSAPAAGEPARRVPPRPMGGRTVAIRTGQIQAPVRINGQYRGLTPLLVHLPLGVYTLSIDDPGARQMTGQMRVDAHGVALLVARGGQILPELVLD